MYVGYCVGDSHPALESLSDIPQQPDLPTLIVGYDRAVNLYGSQVKRSQFKIGHNLYWCFSTEEVTDSHEQRFLPFLTLCINNIIAKQQRIIVHDFAQVNLRTEDYLFMLDTSKAVIITQGVKIFYLNKELCKFFKLDLKAFLLELKANYNVIAWTSQYSYNVQGAFKILQSHKPLKALRILYSPYCDVDLYLGTMIFFWLNNLFNFTIDSNSLEQQTWQNAYYVEEYLSRLTVNVDIGVEDQRVQTLLDSHRNGKIKQRYNGTDKSTGRIFAIGAYSVQTIASDLRDVVIAAEKSWLIEFDYNYFEYSLLFQVCNLPLTKDPHVTTSELIFGNDQHRDQAKIINYSILYGKGEIKLAEELRALGLLNVDQLIISLKQRLKPIFELRDSLIDEWHRTKSITNVFGRKVMPNAEHKCLNYYIQSTAADFLIRKIIKCAKLLEQHTTQDTIVLQNHDSILFNLAKSTIMKTAVVEQLKDMLQQSESGKLTLKGTVDIKHGKTWKMSS